MALYHIYAGLGGSFGGAQYVGSVYCNSAADASEIAHEYAVDEYQSYEGSNGINDIDDIYDNLEDFGIDEDDPNLDDCVNDAYTEEVESWINYYAIVAEDDTDFDEEEIYL